MGLAGAFPLLVTGSAQPAVSLPSLQLGSSAANPTPLLTGSEQLHLRADSDPSLADDVEQEMDALCPKLQHIYFFEDGVSQQLNPPALLTSSDLQSLDHILSIVLSDLRKSDLLVWDLPKP